MFAKIPPAIRVLVGTTSFLVVAGQVVAALAPTYYAPFCGLL